MRSGASSGADALPLLCERSICIYIALIQEQSGVLSSCKTSCFPTLADKDMRKMVDAEVEDHKHRTISTAVSTSEAVISGRTWRTVRTASSVCVR